MAGVERAAEHSRFEYSAIVHRPKLSWPGGARVAVWVVPNIEHFRFDRPAASLEPYTAGMYPDVLNYGWRDYGARVAVWRLLEVIERRGFKATAALNSDVCHHYPRILQAIADVGWEVMGHGQNNSTPINAQSEAEERELIAETVRTLESATGHRPRGWLGPALCESTRTPDLLAEAGLTYVADWTNDEQPYRMAVRTGSMHSIPYSLEVNDFPAFLTMRQSAEGFGQLIRDYFDGLYEDGASTGRVMAICLHPFLTGHPHRAKYVDQALAHIASRQDVWLATGGEIIDWYAAHTASDMNQNAATPAQERA